MKTRRILCLLLAMMLAFSIAFPASIYADDEVFGDELYEEEPNDNNDADGMLYENGGGEDYNNDGMSSGDGVIVEGDTPSDPENGNLEAPPSTIEENEANNDQEEGSDFQNENQNQDENESENVNESENLNQNVFLSSAPNDNTENDVEEFEDMFAVENAALLGNDVTVTPIDSQDKTVEVPIGESVSLEFAPEAEGLTYQWFYKNAGQTGFTRSSIRSSTYTVPMKLALIGREMYCIATDNQGQDYTSGTITIKAPTSIVITKDLDTTTEAAIDEEVKLTVEATGVELKYQWFYKNAGQTEFTKSSIRTPDYTVPMKAALIGRQLYCIVSDKYHTSRPSAVTTLEVPNSIVINQDFDATTEAAIGEDVALTVEATGDENLTYQWYFKNDGQTGFTKSSFTVPTYAVTMKEALIGREIYCRVTDSKGAYKDSTHTVLQIPVAKFTFTQDLDATTDAAIGEDVALTVEATGDENLTYQWYFKNAGQTGFKKSSITGPTYAVTMKEALIGREIYCRVTDSKGAYKDSTHTVLQPFIYDNILYAMNENGLTVVGYAEPSTATQLTIPATVEVHGENMTVNEIGEEAFMDNTNLQSVFLPDSIVTIHARAFKGCSNLYSMGSSNHQ